MSASLNRKLNRSKERYRTKQALTKAELKGLLAWLREDQTIKGLENYGDCADAGDQRPTGFGALPAELG